MNTDSQIREAMLEELRRRGWTQQQLADELGVSKSAVAQLLSGGYGRVPPSLLKALDTLGLQLTVEEKSQQDGALAR